MDIGLVYRTDIGYSLLVMSMVKTYIAEDLAESQWLDRATIIGFDLAYLAYGPSTTSLSQWQTMNLTCLKAFMPPFFSPVSAICGLSGRLIHASRMLGLPT